MPDQVFRLLAGLLLSLGLLSPLLAPVLPAAAQKAKGFIVTPSRVDVVLPPGTWTSVAIRFIGSPPEKWRVVRFTSTPGVNVTLEPITRDGVVTGLNVTVLAYRPGYYKYGVELVSPVETTSGGSVRAIPVIVVPVDILVPGVRIELQGIYPDPVTGFVRVCYSLGVYGLEKLNRTSIDVRVSILVDDSLVASNQYTLRAGTSYCVTIGPYPQGSRHRLTLVAEAPGVSRDAVESYFVVGRVSATLRAWLSLPPVQLGMLGGIVRAEYRVEIVANTSRCVASGLVALDGEERRIEFAAVGTPGVTEEKEYKGIVSVYMKPSLIPIRFLRAHLNLTLACQGVKEKPSLHTSGETLYIDTGVLGAYALGAVLAAILVVRARKRRRRKGEEEASEQHVAR